MLNYEIKLKAEHVNKYDAKIRCENISVVITLYNYERYIEETITSVINQCYENIDLIIIDDQSTDNSCDIALDVVSSKLSRFRNAIVMSAMTNQGLAKSRNLGFKLSKSQYIFSLDADNPIFSSAVSKLYKAIEPTDPQKVAFVYSQLLYFDEVDDIGIADTWDPKKLAQGNYIDNMSLIRKEAWEKVGGYSEMPVPGWEDFDLWCKFHEAGFEGVFLPEILCKYRVRNASMLRSSTNKNIEILMKYMRKNHKWITL